MSQLSGVFLFVDTTFEMYKHLQIHPVHIFIWEFEM